MKKIAIFFIPIVAFYSCETKHHTPEITEEKITSLDSFLTSIIETHPVPGLGVAIIKDDQVISRALGYADARRKRRLYRSTPLFMGNFSEVMLATAIMHLVEKGQISLDDPVSTHLPYFLVGGKPNKDILIRHLLTHSSGIPSHDAVWDTSPKGESPLEATTRSISLQEPEFVPAGTKVKRSQYSYDILADVVSKATGVPFEDFMNEAFLPKLGLSSAFYSPTLPNLESVALPHRIDDWLAYEVKVDTVYPHNPEHSGSTGFHSSIDDLSRWMSTVLRADQKNYSFPGRAAVDLLFADGVRTSRMTAVGYGWEIDSYKDAPRYTKTFYQQGFSGDMILVPQLHLGIVVVSNTASEFDPTMVVGSILAWLEGNPLLHVTTPAHISFGRVFRNVPEVDSAMMIWERMEVKERTTYDSSIKEISRTALNLLYKEQRVSDAIDVFEFLTKRFPDDPSARLDLAEAYIVKRDTLNAAKQLRASLETGVRENEDLMWRHTGLEEALNILREDTPPLPAEDYFTN